MKLNLVLFYCCLFIALIALNIVNPIIPSLVKDLGGSALDNAIIQSLTGVAGILGAAGLGKLSDIPGKGRKLAIIVQFLGTAISYGIILIASKLWVIMIGVVFGSVTHHASAPVLAFVADSVGKEQSPKYMAISGAIGGVALIVGSFTTTGLLSTGIGYFTIILVAICLCLLAFGVSFVFVKEPLASVERKERMKGETNLSGDDLVMEKIELKYISKHHWIIFYAMFAAYFSNAGPIAVYPYLISHMFDWGAASLAALLAAAGVCFVIAQLAFKYLSEKLGSLQLLSVISLATISLTVFLLPLVNIRALHVIIFCLFIVANSLIITAIPSQLSQETSGGKQGQIQGIGQAFQTFAGVIAPVTTGALFTKIDDGGMASFLLCSMISVSGTCLIAYDWFRNRHVLRKSSEVGLIHHVNEDVIMDDLATARGKLCDQNEGGH